MVEENKIEDNGILSLCEAFLKNKKLEELNLNKNAIGDIGICTIISTCKELCKIKKVHISNINTQRRIVLARFLSKYSQTGKQQ